MKLLFVCTANQQRSPTAEELINKNYKYEAKSAGISPLSGTFISQEAIDWADKIFVMERKHKDFIEKKFNTDKEIIVFNIPDEYYKNEPELIKVLKNKIGNYL